MSEYVEMISLTNGELINVGPNDAISKLYYLDARLPNDDEIRKLKCTRTRENAIDFISKQDKYIPLFDIFTSNIYIITKRNVYIRVVHNNYRFPDELIIKHIKQEKHHEKDPLSLRKLRKSKLMLDFLANFNMKILYESYLKVFYLYSPELGNSSYTCVRRSFIPHIGHILPYYTKDEILRLGMNQGIIQLPSGTTYIDFKDTLTNNDFIELCDTVAKNDISAKTLILHQKYIIDNDLAELVQYYTVQGSYFMNKYLRGQPESTVKNNVLEENISKIWKLILSAPQFDNEYILYRFVQSDAHLKHLKTGDKYVERGFTSTTRDPFYRDESYEFGFVLIKIHIPKNIKGVCLSLELLSHFPKEEEIIFPPLAEFKLINKDNKCAYYHINTDYIAQIHTRYEFEWVQNNDIKFSNYVTNDDSTPPIDFINIGLRNDITMSIENKIDILLQSYVTQQNQIKCKIGDKYVNVIVEQYDSTGAYKHLYSITTPNGFCLYAFQDGSILFMIEIGQNQMRVNYINRYSHAKKTHLDDDIILYFLASVAYFFGISDIVMYAEYVGCKINTNAHDKDEQTALFIDEYNDNKRIDAYSTHQTNHNYIGGAYCIDYYKYLKSNWKRFDNTNAHNTELRTLFSFDDLDDLKKIKPSQILRKEDRDELYQVYTKVYNMDNFNHDNIADFYVWTIENMCYLTKLLVEKFKRYYKTNNPFQKDMYIFGSMTYLYNRKYVNVFNRHLPLNIDETRDDSNLPKNNYRIQR